MKIISHTPKKKNTASYDRDNIYITLTCQSGFESLVRRESERLGLTETTGQDRLVSGRGSLEVLYRLLIGSRFANRVYIDVTPLEKGGKGGFCITDFDTLHDILADISWGDYLTGRENIIIEASSTRSVLTSIPTIQSVAQKAIFSTLHTPNNANAIEVHILILIIDDITHILLDVTGDPLHKRGYREESGEAPIKESLAAALVVFSGWRFREPLHDPFCWSGTIAIEAAMMARNIPPGLSRFFRIESLSFHDRGVMTWVKDDMRGRIYPSGSYQISGSDLSPEMIEIAERNAERAGVGGDIKFSVENFLAQNSPPEKGEWEGVLPQKSEQTHPNPPFSWRGSGTIVTNPPYGNRLESDDLDEIYKKLIAEVSKNGGGFITNYPVDVRYGLANRKLLNGSDECRFYYKK